MQQLTRLKHGIHEEEKMSDIVSLLEKLGSDASLRFATDATIAKTLDEQEISAEQKEAVMKKNSQLIAELADAPKIICQSIKRDAPDPDDPEDSDSDSEESQVSNG